MMMVKQINAKIFLADERGVKETAEYTCSSTFNFGDYQSAHKKAHGDLYLWNDEELAGDGAVSNWIEEASFILLLPLAGAVKMNDNKGNESLVAAGQVQLISVDAGTTLTLSNPFPDHVVNFLQIGIKRKPVHTAPVYTHTFENIGVLKNQWVPLLEENVVSEFSHSLTIAQLDGRRELIYQPSKPSADLFLFVIEGAFEAEGRLLHRRDGLLLYNAAAAEAEALSNDALLLVVELPSVTAS